MDKIINWLLLTIIFVFDPLAIALVVAANFAFDQIKSPKFYPQPIRIRQPKKVKMSVPEGMEFDKEYPIPSEDLKQRIKENQEKIKVVVPMPPNRYFPEEEEKRMDIIGQNGNDGLHYDKLDLNKDGVVDKREIEIAIKDLTNKSHEAKMNGNTALYEVYQQQLNHLKEN